MASEMGPNHMKSGEMEPLITHEPNFDPKFQTSKRGTTSRKILDRNVCAVSFHSLGESYPEPNCHFPIRMLSSEPAIQNSLNGGHSRFDELRTLWSQSSLRSAGIPSTERSLDEPQPYESLKNADLDYCKRLYARLRNTYLVNNVNSTSTFFEDLSFNCFANLTSNNVVRRIYGNARKREEAENEWNQVPTIVGKASDDSPLSSAPVTVDQAVQYFKQLDLPKFQENDKPPQEKNKFCEVFKWFKFPALTDDLAKEFEFITSLTKCALNWSDSFQCRMLQTIYKKLTGAKIDCPQRGTHWQLIGFQGNDPATDLRSVGLFGLLQFLHLTSDKVLPLAHKLYKVANSETQPFPLAVLSLNLTNIVLNVFNTGRLNRECIARKSVLDTLNSFYSALMVYTFNVWVTQKKTIKDSGYLLKDAERYCSRNVKKVLRDLPKNLHKYDQ